MNEVRIIGGKWKRRKLGFPNRPELRPTPDRVRETLFNWLLGSLEDARCLDLFAGSGALGFEALSRGAGHVTLVERDRAVIRALQSNCEKLGAQQHCTIVHTSALSWLRRQRQPWDIVFLDPPFRGRQLDAALQVLVDSKLVASGSLVAAEAPARAEPPDERWQVHKRTRAGESQLLLLRPVV